MSRLGLRLPSQPFAPIRIGLLAAGVVLLPGAVRGMLPGINWFAPAMLLGVAVAAMALQRYFFDRQATARRYDGLSDLLMHVHAPAEGDRPSRWALRGLVSGLLALTGAPVGSEGAAIEAANAAGLRAQRRSSRWFEQRRRTDAAMAVAAGVAAAFGAPFAGLLAAIELGIGGRVPRAAVAALTAYVAIRFAPAVAPGAWLASERFGLQAVLQGGALLSPREWGLMALIGLGAGVIGAIGVRLTGFFREGLGELFQTQTWVRVFAGGVLLALVALAYAQAQLPPAQRVGELIWARQGGAELGLHFLSRAVSLALVLAAFGSAGVFWPVFAIGATAGALLDQALFGGLPGAGAAAVLVGGAALWGGLLGLPLAGAVLAFELSGSAPVLGTALVAAALAQFTRAALRTEPLVQAELSARGFALVDGRSASVLEALFVRDAMVADHEQALEHEPVAELHQRVSRSRYPFIPVVNTQGRYLGLLTADQIREGWRTQDPLAAHEPLSRLLEAKDLLYRAAARSRGAATVKANDSLRDVATSFAERACLPVLGDDGRVLGLLFSYNVRLAYEREVARRSLALQHRAFT